MLRVLVKRVHGCFQTIQMRSLTVIPMAKVSPSMTGGRITKWTKDVGEYVECYELLYEFDAHGLTDIDEEENITTRMELECCDEGYLAVVFDPIQSTTCPQLVHGGAPVGLLCETIEEMEIVQKEFNQLGKMILNEDDHVMSWHAYLRDPRRQDSSCCN